MANYFQVTNALGMSNVKLDSQGRASVQFTAKNVSAAPIDGRAVLVSLPPTKPASGAVQKGWVKLEGSAERKFEKDQEQVFAVRIAVPPKSPAGNYIFRLDVVSVAQPDVGDLGPPMSFSVTARARACRHWRGDMVDTQKARWDNHSDSHAATTRPAATRATCTEANSPALRA